MKKSKNNKTWQEKIKIIKKNIPWLERCPFIRTVLISGSLARGQASEDSDIDLFVIFKKNHIFTGRFFLVLRSKFLTYPKGKDKSKFCLNHFCTDSLESISEKNPYTAFLMTHFLPIIDDGYFFYFKKKNAWSKEFFPDGNLQKDCNRKPIKSNLEIFLEKKLISFLAEKFFEAAQRLKIFLNPATHKKGAKIIVSKKEIALHPEPKSEAFIREFEKTNFGKAKPSDR